MSSDNSFIHNDFLLESDNARLLYHDYVKKLPIIDYHNHLSPKLISENTIFDSITSLWLEGDHYKWRALRTLGISERFITGNASDKEKFIKYMSTVPLMVRNPLYHWTHLELKRYFGISDTISIANAEKIFQETNTMTKTPEFSTLSLLKKMNVERVCTTDDPLDSLKYHKSHSLSGNNILMNPTFRPDKFLLIKAPDFNKYIDVLEEKVDFKIETFENFCEGLEKRIEYFHVNGCRISDHGLQYVPFHKFTELEIENIFKKRRRNESLLPNESEKFQTALLLFLGRTYFKFGWIQQFHLGAMRNNNGRMYNLLGADSGWDSIGQYPIATSLSDFLNELDKNEQLSKTILYNLNPADNAMMASMIGNFNDGSIAGKVQWGSGWWFLDQIDGITNQINTLSNIGIISCFIGMLTDSRSFLSFPRHEYFRRLLCNIFGNDIERGKLPNDISWIGKIVSDISYHNAKKYFVFDDE